MLSICDRDFTVSVQSDWKKSNLTQRDWFNRWTSRAVTVLLLCLSNLIGRIVTSHTVKRLTDVVNTVP